MDGEFRRILFPEISRPLSNVLPDQVVDIPASGAEQSNNIGRSDLLQTMDSPIPIGLFQMVENAPQLLARGFSHESDELMAYLHAAPPIQL